MKTFPLQSLRNGRIYKLSAAEVRAFYDAEIRGIAKYRRLDGVLRFLDGRTRDGIQAVGSVLLILSNREGEVCDVRAGANLVVTTGLNAVIDRLQGTSVGVHDFQALGTGTTAAALGNTTLETELTGGSNSRIQGTLSQPTAVTDRLVSLFSAGNGTGAVTETGRLTASSGGNLFARQVFSVVTKGASDTLQTTHDITVS